MNGLPGNKTGTRHKYCKTESDLIVSDRSDPFILIHRDNVRAMKQLRTVSDSEKASAVAFRRSSLFTINRFDSSAFKSIEIDEKLEGLENGLEHLKEILCVLG